MPNLHIGSDPDGKCLVAGPCEGLALENERIVVPICPAHRAQRLRTRGNGHQSGRQKTCGPGEDETLLDEIPAVMTTLHGAALLSPMPLMSRRGLLLENPHGNLPARCPLGQCFACQTASTREGRLRKPLQLQGRCAAVARDLTDDAIAFNAAAKPHAAGFPGDVAPRETGLRSEEHT